MVISERVSEMDNQEKWKGFWVAKRSVLLLYVFALVSSTLSAAYTYRWQMVDMSEIDHYIFSPILQEIGAYDIIHTFWFYFRRYLYIWLLGEISLLLPLALVGTFLIVFAYGYSIVCLYIKYAAMGILLSVKLFILQGVILCALLLQLCDYQLRRRGLFYKEFQSEYIKHLIAGALGCLGITFVENLLFFLMR